MEKQNEQRLVPKLRFKGFSEDWEQEKLSNMANIVGGGTPSTKESSYWNGDINWFTPNEIGDSKYVKDSLRKITEKGLNNSSAQLLPANKTILFTSRATIGTIGILEEEASTNQGFQSLIVNDFNDVNFLYYKLLTMKKLFLKNSVGSTFLEISGKTMKKIDINIPSKTEQEKIGKLLSRIDKAISLHKRKLKIIDETIHELREQLFSTKYIAGKKVKSEKMKLNDFLEEVIEYSDKENQYPLLSSTNNGIETRSGRVSGSSNIGYKILRKNQLVLSPQNLWLGNININRDFEVGIVSPSYKVFDIKNIKIIYLENILKTERMKYNFEKISIQGASVVRRNLDMKEFLNLEVRVTQKNEQEKLVKTFVQLSNIKFSLRSKIKILEKLKILYLDKMFI